MFKEIIIKMKLKKELTKEIYSKLSYDIQRNPRIIEHLIKSNPSLISLIPDDIDITNYVLQNYDLINYLTDEQLNNCIWKLDISKINITEKIFEKLIIM